MSPFSGALLVLPLLVLWSSVTLGADPSSFPGSGIDAQSLGRGGTVIACPPGFSSAFGNPATLTPEGFFSLGAEYLTQRGTPGGAWGLSVLDTSSAIRGALTYYKDPQFAGFKSDLWSVSFSQSIMPSLFMGESFHTGRYEPTASPGSEERLSALDVGFLLQVGSYVSVGYVAHNLWPSDKDLLEETNGFGISFLLPKSMLVALDYEEGPQGEDDNDVRAGFQFQPHSRITGRIGYQDLATGTRYYTAGVTYADMNGTLDAAILYDEELKRTDRVVLGISIRM